MTPESVSRVQASFSEVSTTPRERGAAVHTAMVAEQLADE
jgi:hypothetical protein